MLTEKYFDTGDVTIHYVEGPHSGPPLMLLHGISGQWQVFQTIMPSLIIRWQVFALDNRGSRRCTPWTRTQIPDH